MRAGAGSDHQEEGVLYLTMQPDDAGQPAKHFTLAALGRIAQIAAGNTALGRAIAGGGTHEVSPAASGGLTALCSERTPSSRAARSFSKNCVAFRR